MSDDGGVKTTSRSAKVDAVLADAVDVARDALREAVGEAAYGDPLGATAEEDRVLTHYFEARLPGYRGWRFAVTVARAPRSKNVTVNEVVLLPGADALLAPPWLPWKDRVAKEDLGPGDLMPVTEDDPRLVPGYLVGDAALDASSARDAREVVRELGLGRERVLSVTGRDLAAQRWYDGGNGPAAPIAQAAPAACGTCGFLVRLSGPLRAAFGVCANEYSPSDGQVVSYDHGCGAHSDVRLDPSQSTSGTAATPVFDTVARDTWEIWGDSDLEVISR